MFILFGYLLDSKEEFNFISFDSLCVCLKETNKIDTTPIYTITLKFCFENNYFYSTWDFIGRVLAPCINKSNTYDEALSPTVEGLG